MSSGNGIVIGKPVVNDVEDIKTVTYFQNKPISQQWFMVFFHTKLPMLNAPENRSKRLKELKSIAKSVQCSQDRQRLMMKITNNDKEDGSLELKFYLPDEHSFQRSVDCRKIDLFKRSKRDRTFFYFTLMTNSTSTELRQFECQIYHAIGISSADFIADLMDKQVRINLKDCKIKSQLSLRFKKAIGSQSVNEIEKCRQYDNEHPLDESLEEAACKVPTLLDLDLEDQTKPRKCSMNISFSEPIKMDSNSNRIGSQSTNPFVNELISNHIEPTYYKLIIQQTHHHHSDAMKTVGLQHRKGSNSKV